MQIKQLFHVAWIASFALTWLIALAGLLAPYVAIERMAILQVIPPALPLLGGLLLLFLVVFIRTHQAGWATVALIGVLGVTWTQSKDLRPWFRAGDAPAVLHVFSYNVASFQFEAQYVRRVADLVRERQPDVVALQEFRNHDMGEGQDALRYMAQAMGLPHYRFERLPQHIHGAVIFSRYPIVEIDTLFMPAREINTGIIATLETPQGRIGIGNLHLSSYRMKSLIANRDPGDRLGLVKNIYHKSLEVLSRQQAMVDRVLHISARYPHPLVLVGDFNAVPHSRILHLFARRYTDSYLAAGQGLGWTYPIWRSLGLRIDYQFASEGLRPTRHHVLRQSYSDHYPTEVGYDWATMD